MFQGSKIWHYFTNGFVIIVAASIFAFLIFVGLKVYSTVQGSSQEVRAVESPNKQENKQESETAKSRSRNKEADKRNSKIEDKAGKRNANDDQDQKVESREKGEISRKPSAESVGLQPKNKTENEKLTQKIFNELDLLKSMVLLTGSDFVMGNDNGSSDEKPAHTVRLNSIYVDKYEVTVKDFRDFCEAANHEMPVQPSWNKDDHPVVNVTFHDAESYAKWKGKRLPTEAEWEFIARGGDARAEYPWKNGEDSRAFANFKGTGGRDNWEQTSPVGSFAPNKFGIYDIGGNVREWCSDWYDRGYNDTGAAVNPSGPKSGTRKVVRGGSWDYEERFMRITNRDKSIPSNKSYNLGFRCVKSAN